MEVQRTSNDEGQPGGPQGEGGSEYDAFTPLDFSWSHVGVVPGEVMVEQRQAGDWWKENRLTRTRRRDVTRYTQRVPHDGIPR